LLTALYRLYFAPKAFLLRAAEKHPWLRRPIEQCKKWMRKLLLRSGDEWVSVRAGLSAGLEMRLHFPEEAGVWRGEHEPEVQRAIEAVVRPGWVVFDVGAAIGTFALGIAKLVSPGGRVVAFEADPAQTARLREHVSRNNFGSIVQIVEAAVWSDHSASSVPFRRGSRMRTQGGVESGGIRPILGDGELIRVPVTSLDGFVASTGIAPHLIKIDVEGAEYQVLCGGEVLFANHRPLVIAEIHTVNARDCIQKWMAEHRYAIQGTVLFDPVPIRVLAWPQEREVDWKDAGLRVAPQPDSQSASQQVSG
jgi:FkbM family methyltransferase